VSISLDTLLFAVASATPGLSMRLFDGIAASLFDHSDMICARLTFETFILALTVRATACAINASTRPAR
jgi:hypothetical protein